MYIMGKTKEEVYAKNRADYASSKEVPECPRCRNRQLEFKKGHPEEHFIWCKECRRKNRIYKYGVRTKDVQILTDRKSGGRQVELQGGKSA